MTESLESFLCSESNWDTTKAFLGSLTAREVIDLERRWDFLGRREQLAPPGAWTTWLYLGGRGAGKTRSGAEWIRARVESGAGKRIALVGATASDARDVMVEGESGILATALPWDRPQYEPSKRRITWSNGAVATLYSAEEPDSLRGPQHDTAWCDELAKWSRLRDAWDNLQFGLRLGERPQQMITTTPRPLKLLKEIMARSDTAVTRGSTHDNKPNLAPAFFAEVIRRYEGTRVGRQEIDAEILDDVPGALWTRDMIDQARFAGALPDFLRVVVGVDPSGTRGGDGNDCIGIVVVGKAAGGIGYVLGDYTCSLSPAAWGRRVVEAANAHKADCIVAESNFGGAMVESVLRTAGVTQHIKMVNASRGKAVRAEPIAALYEQKRVRHVGAFAPLEDQLCAFTTEGYVGEGSPDRADALVWALTDLMIPKSTGEEGWIEYAQEKLAQWRKEGRIP